MFLPKQAVVPNKFLAPDYTPILEGTNALTYILSRGMDREDTIKWSIGMGTARYYDSTPEEWPKYAGNGRVIFPDYGEDNQIEYWVARTYVEHKAKYKNAPWSAADQVFNLQNQRSSFIVIVEGPIDVIVGCKYTEGRTVGTYGANVTEEQIIRLAEEFSGRYYICLDPDAKKNALKTARGLRARNCEDIWMVDIPDGEDPASLGPKFPEFLNSATRFDPMEIM